MNRALSLLCAVALAGACSGGGSTGSSGDFVLIEFLLAGQNEIARNERLRFVFSGAVAPGQNLPERIKIENVQTGGAVPNFSLAVGDRRVGESFPGAGDGKGYEVNGAIVDFWPRLPSPTLISRSVTRLKFLK